ncbi:MAG: alpha/beta-type small acid-soluble spore protein [Eubacterium sp.]|nr:alpha/beta-type small acid-soluble spore protein [Eubacterium sp.]
MSGSKNSNSNSNSGMAVPEAKEAMRQFKEEVASELGVNLKNGYNGDLTSREAGSIGGEMVKKMIMRQEEQMKQ